MQACLHHGLCLQTMLKRQYIVSVGWDRRLFYYEDTKADKRPVTACRIVPDARLEQQANAAHQGHTSDVLTAAMQVPTLLLESITDLCSAVGSCIMSCGEHVCVVADSLRSRCWHIRASAINAQQWKSCSCSACCEHASFVADSDAQTFLILSVQ